MKIYTVGHSNQSAGEFLALLSAHGITTVVDVRSSPSSRFARYRKNELRRALSGAGIAYLFLGNSLGGRPANRELYRKDGALDPERVRHTPAYGQGLQRLLERAGAAGERACVMCAEEDPARCHRTTLIAPDLQSAGAEVVHLRRRRDGPDRPLQQELPWQDER
jgi:uncharacterized protein (DUF488 family)